MKGRKSETNLERKLHAQPEARRLYMHRIERCDAERYGLQHGYGFDKYVMDNIDLLEREMER